MESWSRNHDPDQSTQEKTTEQPDRFVSVDDGVYVAGRCFGFGHRASSILVLGLHPHIPPVDVGAEAERRKRGERSPIDGSLDSRP